MHQRGSQCRHFASPRKSLCVFRLGFAPERRVSESSYTMRFQTATWSTALQVRRKQCSATHSKNVYLRQMLLLCMWIDCSSAAAAVRPAKTYYGSAERSGETSWDRFRGVFVVSMPLW